MYIVHVKLSDSDRAQNSLHEERESIVIIALKDNSELYAEWVDEKHTEVTNA